MWKPSSKKLYSGFFLIIMIPRISLYKPRPLPDLLAYRVSSKNNDVFIYKMFNRHTGEIVGMMKAKPETICETHKLFFPENGVFHSFFIERLFAFKRNCGVGTALINIAKRESVRNFCSGNVHVISSGLYDPVNPPHIFYRKQGFNFNQYSKLTQEHVDECIKNGTQIDVGRFGGRVIMHIAKCLKNQEQDINRLYEFKIKFPDLFNYIV